MDDIKKLWEIFPVDEFTKEDKAAWDEYERRTARAKVIEENFGILDDETAQAVGVNAAALAEIVEASDGLKLARSRGRDRLRNLAERALVKAIEAGNVDAAIFVAETLGRSRGYEFREEPPPAGDAATMPGQLN